MALRLNKAHAQCLAGIVSGAAESKSVLLSDLATRLPGNATTTSKFRRLQDFFLEVLLDFNAVAALVMGFAVCPVNRADKPTRPEIPICHIYTINQAWRDWD